MDTYIYIHPTSWNVIDFFEIPKGDDATGWDGYRWMGKLDCCFQWYTRCLQPLVQPSLRDSSVCTLGFKKDAVALKYRRLCNKLLSWGNGGDCRWYAEQQTSPLRSSQSTNVCSEWGMHPHLARAILREISGMYGLSFCQVLDEQSPFPSK